MPDHLRSGIRVGGAAGSAVALLPIVLRTALRVCFADTKPRALTPVHTNEKTQSIRLGTFVGGAAGYRTRVRLVTYHPSTSIVNSEYASAA